MHRQKIQAVSGLTLLAISPTPSILLHPRLILRVDQIPYPRKVPDHMVHAPMTRIHPITDFVWYARFSHFSISPHGPVASPLFPSYSEPNLERGFPRCAKRRKRAPIVRKYYAQRRVRADL